MFKRSLKVLAFAAFFWCCCFLSIGQTQNTYLLGLTNDHYSTIESSMTPGNFVHVGTVATSTTSGTHDIHAMEVDGAGNIVWEWIYQTAQDERAFHVDESPNGYIISGYISTGQNQLLLVEIDPFGGIIQQASYPDSYLGSHAHGLHVRAVNGDPLGGFIVAGIASTGVQDNSAKAAMLLKVDAALNSQWVRYYDSPSTFNDYDMGSHVLEVPGKGYFMSGSCNAMDSDQLAYGVMTDYTGTFMWDTEYADNNGSGHTCVAASAIYDAQTDQVIQLSNLTIVHHWGITTYDVTTGIRDLSKSFRVFSNLGYANIQGFRLLQAPNQDNLIIAGYMRDHFWPEVDEAGNQTGNTLTGSPPFMCEVDKLGTNFLWDNMYLVPSPGYTASPDIFGAFSAGQQPRILHPEMALRKSDGLGYWMNAYNNNGSGQFDIEIIELDLVGANPCSAAPLDFTFATVAWFDEDNVDDIASSVPKSIPGLQPSPITPAIQTCVTTGPCVPDADFQITDLGDCCFQFDDLTPDPNSPCAQWDILDSAGNIIFSGAGNSWIHCFQTSGTYQICYTDCCVNPDGTVVTAQTCQFLDVDCAPCVPDATFQITDLGDCCYQFDDLTLSDPTIPSNCDIWEIIDPVTGVVIANSVGDSWTYCFQQSGSFIVCHTDCCTDAAGNNIVDTQCQDIYVDCGCEVEPFDFTWAPAANPLCPNECSIGFGCPVIDDSKFCVHWDFGDGQTYDVANSCPIHCYDACGTYDVCLTIYCCEDDTQSITVCHEVQVDCCTLPFDWYAAVTVDDCSACFSPIFEGPCPTDCITWDFGDGSTGTGVYPCHSFPGSGVYNVCMTACCCSNLDAAGNPIDPALCTTICKEIEIECCDADATFSAEPVGDCCYEFTDLTPDPDAFPVNNCNVWYVYDLFGNVIASSTGDVFNYCFPESGDYVVCHTDCCFNPDGTITEVTHCETYSIDCPCPLPILTNVINVSSDDCNWGFCVEGIFDVSKHCATWDFGDGTVENHPLDICPTHKYDCDGNYTVCVTVYCCDDDTISATLCVDIVVDCPCELPQGDFAINTDGCTVTADAFLLSPALCVEDYCVSWDWGDGSPTTAGFWGMHIYDADGTYTICMTVYCCEDDSIFYTVCHTVTVDCPCTQPEPFDIQVVTSDNCEFGFCAIGDFDYDEHCVTWDWGDGIVENHPLDFCPIHQYTCDGDYIVCATVYCCDDPSISTTVCTDVTVYCGCHLPETADLLFAVDQCNIEACVIIPQQECPNYYCYSWDFGDGTSVNSDNECEPHTYSASGTYTVCVTIACCDYIIIQGLTVCQDITVNCCDLGTPDFDVDIDECTACFAPTIDGLPVGSDICYDFHFMWNIDATVGTADANPCYTYPESGTYTVCMHIWCCDDPNNIQLVCKDITVDCPCDLPSGVDFGIDQTDCTVAVGAITTDDYNGELCFEWDFGDGSASVSGETASHMYSESGHYTICLTVFCCDDPSVSMTVCHEVCVICPCTLPQVDIIYDIVNCTAYYSVAGLTSDIAGICYDWDFGDGTGGSGTSVNHTYAASGTYTVCLTVYCCDDTTTAYTICLQVAVECPACDLPSGAGIDCSVNDCTAAFGAFYTDDYTGPLCFIWDFGDGTPPAFSEVAAHTYFASGTYNVCLYIHCCNDPSEVMSVCKEVTVECDGQCPEPCELAPRFTWNQDAFTYAQGCCTHFTDVSVAGSSTTITGWSWGFGDGTTSNLQHPSHCYATPGVHEVCLTITGTSPDGDCTQTFCWEIECGCEDTCVGDLDHDGDINTADILILLISYGTQCP